MRNGLLDEIVAKAIEKLRTPTKGPATSAEAYSKSFRKSAEDKAQVVLGLLASKLWPYHGRKPVFVSVGGSDGAELEYLLSKSDASHGVLIEMVPPAAATARERATDLQAQGKHLEVMEGEAQRKIDAAMEWAIRMVREGHGEFIAVTCHAVLHELPDRGEGEFDSLAFFAKVFCSQEVPIWFSYREPGRPPDWPDEVLLQADCEPATLLRLAEVIAERHATLKALKPDPLLVGDGVRLHASMAMEVLTKLFYIDDLGHELQERITAVDHTKASTTVGLAIGDKAFLEGRARISTESGPSSSFSAKTEQLGVRVRSLQAGTGSAELGVGQSHTRLISWRVPRISRTPGISPASQTQSTSSAATALAMARVARSQGDHSLVEATFDNSGRYWIESPERDNAGEFLAEIKAEDGLRTKVGVLAHYLSALPLIFSGEASLDLFSVENEELAEKHGLGLLFAAERMEVLRKLGRLQEAIALANGFGVLELPDSASLSQRYSTATAMLLVANLLRRGGRYREALDLLARARDTYVPGIPSHDVERAHCEYGILMCRSILGDVAAELHTAPLALPYEFASGLISLSFAHLAWLARDPHRAVTYAEQAAEAFQHVSLAGYVERAQKTVRLLQAWERKESGQQFEASHLEGDLGVFLRGVSGGQVEEEAMSRALAKLRPATVLSLLQFVKSDAGAMAKARRIELPPVLVREGGQWRLAVDGPAQSLDSADKMLRAALGLPVGARLPLMG